MPLRVEPILSVPKETARIARAAFPKSNLYLKMRDELGTFLKMMILPTFSTWLIYSALHSKFEIFCYTNHFAILSNNSRHSSVFSFSLILNE